MARKGTNFCDCILLRLVDRVLLIILTTAVTASTGACGCVSMSKSACNSHNSFRIEAAGSFSSSIPTSRSFPGRTPTLPTAADRRRLPHRLLSPIAELRHTGVQLQLLNHARQACSSGISNSSTRSGCRDGGRGVQWRQRKWRRGGYRHCPPTNAHARVARRLLHRGGARGGGRRPLW